MRRSGAWLAVRALEAVGVRYTFGIPGVHNTEIYDELRASDQIEPILVTHEQNAAFMADAVSRTTGSIGCAVIVPAAGTTNAMSGIGEAYLDGIPMLVISGGIRRDTGKAYQLHDIDQRKLVAAVTKAAFVVDRHEHVVDTIYRAYDIATAGEPGPVFVEIASDVLLFVEDCEPVRPYQPSATSPDPDPELVAKAAGMLAAAKRPGLYLGWGARGASAELTKIAERFSAPVATTLQGLSVFDAAHPLHTGMGFGPSAVPAARNAFNGCDCLLAVGVRFSELGTASYGLPVPQALIHVDINRGVFDKNYPAALAIEADAQRFSRALLDAVGASALSPRSSVVTGIAADKQAYRKQWTARTRDDKVSPGIFFRELSQKLGEDAFVVADDGNHTFLTAELLPMHRPAHFISPTDFNCMGYAVPAAIATKLANPDEQVVAIVGDGGFLMSGLEIITANKYGIAPVFFVFNDGELGQIAQFQAVPLKHKTCTVLGDVRFEGIAKATGAGYFRLENDAAVPDVLGAALDEAKLGKPIIVDVNIDYSKKSAFTEGVIKVNFSRFPLRQKARLVGRALKRHTIG
ncbi:MAG: thiamine pyrophosphate-binding protein [Deltaproteobacteria bacterium]|nr:thiamine pyrophosphate-binding protein [Deltaproteobacteria bacterium]